MECTSQPSIAGDQIMARAAHPKTLYEALQSLPEGIMGEILGGQLHTQPRPAAPHAIAASRLGAHVCTAYDLRRRGPGGWWILDEPELHFVRDTEILVPDLAGWRRERMTDVPADHRFEVVPDWICEVLSPATRSKDREIKMPLYARYGVAHAWLVDPAARTLETYESHGGQWKELGVYSADDTVTAAPFEAAAFELGDLWS